MHRRETDGSIDLTDLLDTGTREVSVLSYTEWENIFGANVYQEYVEERVDAGMPHLAQSAWLRQEGQRAYSVYTTRLAQDAASTGILLHWPRENAQRSVDFASNHQSFDWQLQEALRQSEVRPIVRSRS